jgi:hypothetical protein
MGENQKAWRYWGLFSFGLGRRGAARFHARLQSLDVLSVLPSHLPVFFSSSRHHSSDLKIL